MRSEFGTKVWKVAGIAALGLQTACGGSGGQDPGGGGGTAANAEGGATGSGGSSAAVSGAGQPEARELPVCDTAENNLQVAGIDGMPLTMSGALPTVYLGGVHGRLTALGYEASTARGLVNTELTSDSGRVESGKDFSLGADEKMRVQINLIGSDGSATPAFCEIESGEAKIRELSSHAATSQAVSVDVPDTANVSFAGRCRASTAKPVGVTEVSGCYNLVKQTQP